MRGSSSFWGLSPIYVHFFFNFWTGLQQFIENLNTKLGYYESEDILTRHFNEVIVGEKITLKNSFNINKLKSEINFLNNVPPKIKKFFPQIRDYGKNFYKMDTINGLKMSYLLVNNLITKEDLTNI